MHTNKEAKRGVMALPHFLRRVESFMLKNPQEIDNKFFEFTSRNNAKVRVIFCRCVPLPGGATAAPAAAGVRDADGNPAAPTGATSAAQPGSSLQPLQPCQATPWMQ
jgi:hypothetical protein